MHFLDEKRCVLCSVKTAFSLSKWFNSYGEFPLANKTFHIRHFRNARQTIVPGHVYKLGCRQGVAPPSPPLQLSPQILSSCYVYKHLRQKYVQNLEKQDRKNSFQVISSVTHTKIPWKSAVSWGGFPAKINIIYPSNTSRLMLLLCWEI